MQSERIDPIVKRAIADGVLQRAARELDKLLEELAAALDPFPFFMGTSSIQALEIDPAGVADPKRGCVVVLPDGRLRELVLRMMPAPSILEESTSPRNSRSLTWLLVIMWPTPMRRRSSWREFWRSAKGRRPYISSPVMLWDFLMRRGMLLKNCLQVGSSGRPSSSS